MNDEISTQSLLSAGFDHCRSLWIDGCFCFDHSPTILANRMVMAAGDDHFSLREPHTAAGTGDCVGKATRNQEFQGATQIRDAAAHATLSKIVSPASGAVEEQDCPDADGRGSELQQAEVAQGWKLPLGYPGHFQGIPEMLKLGEMILHLADKTSISTTSPANAKLAISENVPCNGCAWK